MPASTPVIVAVLPASGRSSRFGSDKRAALIDGVPMLERTRQRLADAGVARVDIVDDNPDPDRGMFSTIQIGLARASDADVALVHPADMPFVSVETVRSVAAECVRTGRAVCPSYRGKRGHPLALPRAIVEKLLTLDPSRPLNEALADVGAVRVELTVDDPGAIRDVDVPKDLVNGEW
jgi:molybdenum cofactor cytidylyltransferase